MREIAFIKQNKEKWLEFEQAIFGKTKKNPDDLANLYIHLVNDLSYAQTYYPKSKTVVYLNHLASQIYQKIYPLYTSMSFCTPSVTEIFSIKLVLISMSVIIKIPTMTLADLTKPCHVQTRVVPYIVL